MYAYCVYDPVNRTDISGQCWGEIGQFFGDIWKGFTLWLGNTFGAGSSTTSTTDITENHVVPVPYPITAKTGTQITEVISQHGNSSKPISVYANRAANIK